MRKNQPDYPYKNTSLLDMPSEKWRDLPFLEGIYRISNFGRVKRLATETGNGKGFTMRLQEKIIKSYPSRAINKGIGDYVYGLSAGITSGGAKHKFSIPRLVYYCFIKKFNLNNFKLVVLPRDGNGKNIQLSNLQLADHRQKLMRVFERNRWHVEYETSYDEYQKGKIKSKNPYTKQVSQYSSKGRKINTFPSIATAAKVTGIKESMILGVLKERTNTGGGFFWAYGASKTIDTVSRRKENLEKLKLLVGRRVTQYSLTGKKIASYLTIKDAGKETKTNPSDIHAVLTDRQRSAGGFIWRDGIGKSSIEVKGFMTGEAWRAFRRQKKVNRVNKKGKVVGSFPSVTEAAKNMETSNSSISTAISKGILLKDSYWRFA